MLPYALFALSLIWVRQVPAGTQLHIRLTTPVGSYASKPGSPVEAVLIAPVEVNGETLLPEGAIFSGTVTRAQPVGLGIAHETATLALDFDTCTLPGGYKMPVATRLIEVDNGRERVLEDGSVRGVRTTASLSYRASGYIRAALAWELHAQLALWAAKMLVVQVPEPEIYYPPGVELTLALRDELVSAVQPDSEEGLTGRDREELRRVTAGMPYRAYTAGNRPSDLMNVLFAGSREEVETAFLAAGWTPASASTLRSRIQGARAVAEGRGDQSAPMSRLLVGDRDPDMLWEKGLNDVSKRHHVRIWKQDATWNGQPLWIAAATRDIDFAFLRHGRTMTHKIEENVDEERDKIAHDFEFTGCAETVGWWNRPGAPTSARNATGDLMDTDGELAVIRMNDCAAPRRAVEAESEPVKYRPSGLKRFLRRQILSVRSDFYRTNIYWRSYEGTRWLVLAIKNRHRAQETPSEEAYQRSGQLAGATGFFARARNSSWLR